MPRYFNTTGPCRRDIHYMLPAAARIPGAFRLIEAQSYFVLHAPRQSGKTTAVLELAAELTASERYAAAVLSCEVGRPFERTSEAQPAILSSWRDLIAGQLPVELQPPGDAYTAPAANVTSVLRTWSERCPRPVVLILDEVDSLAPEVIGSVLAQIRSGFGNRPDHFPQSVGLVGLRDVRDYSILSGGSGQMGAGSPFNVKAESLALELFTRDQVATLYGQHTTETGQVIADAAVDRAYALTLGQPWLVNALMYEALKFTPEAALDADAVDRACEILILRRDTHLDSLAERLRDPRVRGVIETMLAGGIPAGVREEDVRYVRELGLIRVGAAGAIEIANPIYREVVPRALASVAQVMIPPFEPTWLDRSGAIRPRSLLEGFLDFWRQHGEPMLKTVEYHEVAPQLVLMAFLHRVVNGGGTIEREYAVGAGRIDLCVRAPGLVMAMELKVWRDKAADPAPAGLKQLDRYLERLGLDEGYLVVFDRRTSDEARAEAVAVEGITDATTPAGRRVTVVRLG